MLTKYMKSIVIALIVASHSSQAGQKEVSLTIDDLPFVGSSAMAGDKNPEHDRFKKIIQILVEEHIPVTGFVIAGAIAKGQWKLLEIFQKEGFVIGNHTYTHVDLNQVGANQYIKEIEKADKRLTPLMSQKKYFRYPYLSVGRGETRKKVEKFLAANQYTVAPITIDSKDFRFNEKLLAVHWKARAAYLQKMKERYLSYIWKETERAEKRAHGKPVKQILLLHANLLNSHFLPDVIKLYRDHGYKFITLEEALNPVKEEHLHNNPIEAFQEPYQWMINRYENIKSVTRSFFI